MWLAHLRMKILIPKFWGWMRDFLILSLQFPQSSHNIMSIVWCRTNVSIYVTIETSYTALLFHSSSCPQTRLTWYVRCGPESTVSEIDHKSNPHDFPVPPAGRIQSKERPWNSFLLTLVTVYNQIIVQQSICKTPGTFVSASLKQKQLVRHSMYFQRLVGIVDVLDVITISIQGSSACLDFVEVNTLLVLHRSFYSNCISRHHPYGLSATFNVFSGEAKMTKFNLLVQ